MLIDKDDATLLVVDVQQKLLPAVLDPQGMLARCRWLVSAAHDVGLPVVFSEQYPHGLGHTAPELLAAAPAALVVEKLHFSCVAAECLPESLLARNQVVVCGMETHVCVLQTVLELLALGKQVFVVAGAVLVTREMVLFEALRVSGSDVFRAMSKRYLVGEQP